MEFKKYIFHYSKCKINYFIYLLNKKKFLKIEDIISIIVFHIYILKRTLKN